MRNLFPIVMLLLLVLTSFSIAEQQTLGVFHVDNVVELKQTCGSCTQINISSVSLPNSTRILINSPMTKDGTFFNYSFNQTSLIGEYIVDGHDENLTVFSYNFFITPDGKTSNVQTSIIQISLLLFFISLGVALYFINKSVDYKRWYESIVAKYKNKNLVKMVFSAILFNVMKNVYILYYLLGFPIILLAVNMAEIYNLVSIISILNVFLLIYTIGILLVGIIFLSFVQEWISELMNLISDLDWGFK